MARNGSGVYSPPAANYPAVSGTLITAANRNAIDADIATALTNSIATNGESVITANIPLGGNKLTGVGAATARTDAATLATIQDGTGVYVASVAGTADVITLAPSPVITAYTAGQMFSFIASGANTTNVTVNINSLGAKEITKNGTTALVAGDIPSGFLVNIRYDGTRFQLVGIKGAATGANGDITSLTACTSITAGTVTVATGDLVYVQDVSAANVLKVVTAQSIANLASVSAATTTSSGIVELATTAETAARTDTTRAVTPESLQGIVTSGSVINTTSGTSHDFTGIPSWAKLITINISGVSTNGTSPLLFQIGDSGGIENTGYSGAVMDVSAAAYHSAGFQIQNSSAAAQAWYGSFTLSLLSGNTWGISGGISSTSSGYIATFSGSKDLSATLDRVRLTTVNGTDTFDSGTFNILYR